MRESHPENLGTKFGLGDIAIIPTPISPISSRDECNARYLDGTSPLFVAPMDTVLSKENYKYFLSCGLNLCLPRHIYLESHTPNCFESYSLEDFEAKFCENPRIGGTGITHWNIHIDIANGHMYRLYEACECAKEIWGDSLTLMVGNIANPKTFGEFADIGVDYIKLGIGSGNACTTTNLTGIHYPMGSLIAECKKIAQKGGYQTKIIADGGINSSADINIALALGADYVMIGSMFNKCVEASGKAFLKTLFGKMPIPNKIVSTLKGMGFNIVRKYRGMSTTEVQRGWGRKVLRPSEGRSIYNPICYSLKDLITDLEFRLKSAMSYTGDAYLEDFTSGENEYVIKTTDLQKRIEK